MRKFTGILLGLLVVYGALSSPTKSAGFPVVLSTTVNTSSDTLTINGQNFGSSPVVTLDSTTFAVISTSSTQIVADFPNGSPVSSFTPGTYFLTLTFKNHLASIFTVEVGGVGPQGSPGAAGPVGQAGPAGLQGIQGIQGPPGNTGPAGPAGTSGTNGTNGTNGAPGMPGAPGPQGPAGSIGPQGPTGAQGPVGPAGPGSAAGSLVAVDANGKVVGPVAAAPGNSDAMDLFIQTPNGLLSIELNYNSTCLPSTPADCPSALQSLYLPFVISGLVGSHWAAYHYSSDCSDAPLALGQSGVPIPVLEAPLGTSSQDIVYFGVGTPFPATGAEMYFVFVNYSQNPPVPLGACQDSGQTDTELFSGGDYLQTMGTIDLGTSGWVAPFQLVLK